MYEHFTVHNVSIIFIQNPLICPSNVFDLHRFFRWIMQLVTYANQSKQQHKALPHVRIMHITAWIHTHAHKTHAFPTICVFISKLFSGSLHALKLRTYCCDLTSVDGFFVYFLWLRCRFSDDFGAKAALLNSRAQINTRSSFIIGVVKNFFWITF